MLSRLTIAGVLSLALTAGAQQPTPATADPRIRSAEHFDARRPIGAELATSVPDGFSVGAVGDLIISRPLAQYAASDSGFAATLATLHEVSVLYGNLETTIFDPRNFRGAPYSWDGDWTNASLPGVAADLKTMGFGIVSRANNHSLDFGLEGMRETSEHLDRVGIAHAGIGENRGLARAAQFLETPQGRIGLVSIASTFRPTTDALPPQDAAPGRPGLSALHVRRTVELPAASMRALAAIDCGMNRRHCKDTPDTLTLFDTSYRQSAQYRYRHVMDAQDLAEILRSIRSARENADFVIVSIHSHECSHGCDAPDEPRGAGDFLLSLAHQAVDAGADLFVTTGNHNLGAVELYHSPGRGVRPIFYGLGNFFWSDVQEVMPHDLYQGNRGLLEEAWHDPDKATGYDLTAPLNRDSFAHAFTFQSVIAVSRFLHNDLAEVVLQAVDGGYGEKLTRSGIPRRVLDPKAAAAIYAQITDANRRFGLPALDLTLDGSAARIRPAHGAR